MKRTSTNPLISIEAAIARFDRHLPVSETENVALVDALGRFVANNIIAPFPIAPHDSAAMDGFAFRFADLDLGFRMEIVGRVSAGHRMAPPLQQGAAARIFTGGMMPEGADTVAMQEDCEFDDRFVILPDHLREGANRRIAGEDAANGSIVVAAGVRLRPQDIGMAAATGLASIRVRRRVRVAVLATGDELCPPGEARPPGFIYDTNRHAIIAALRSLGAEVTDFGLVKDRLETVRDALEAAAVDHDLVISSGGVSAGDEDHVRAAVLQIGTLDVWNVAIKPGKPVAVGEIQGTPFVGLPGNPVSAMTTFWFIARPMLMRLMGAAEVVARNIPVAAGFRQRHRPGRREYLRARLGLDDDGKLYAEAFFSTGSAMMSSLVWSDGLLVIPEDKGDVEVGDMLDFYSYDALL